MLYSGSAIGSSKFFMRSEVAFTNTFRGSSSPSDPLRSDYDPLSSISTRRVLTARAGFVGGGGKDGVGRDRNLFDSVDD